MLDAASINETGTVIMTVADSISKLFTNPVNWLYAGVLVVAFLNSSRHGFVDRILRLAGSVGSLLVGVGVSKAAAPKLYETYMVPALADRLEQAAREQSTTLVQALQELDFLPAFIRQDLIEQVRDLSGAGTADLFEAIRPILLPLLELLTFAVIYLLVRTVIFVLMRFARGIDTLKPMKWMNHTLGIALGAAEALLAGWWLTVALWLLAILWQRSFSGGAQLIQSSSLYTFFSHFNPFVG